MSTKRSMVSSLVISVVVVLGVLAVYNNFFDETLSQEEVTRTLQNGALEEALAGSDALPSVLHEGVYDETLIGAQIKNVDLPVEMSRFLRFVEVSVTYRMNVEEYKDFQELDALTSQMLDNFDEEGFISFEVSQRVGFGALVGDVVITSSDLFASILVDDDLLERVLIRAVLLPDLNLEDNWRVEVLFDGTARAFSRSSLHGFTPNYPLAVLARPQERLIFEPVDAFYPEAQISDLEPLDVVLYMRNFSGIMSPATGHVSHVLGDSDTILFNGLFTIADVGTPIFVLQDGEIKFAGVLIGGESGIGIATKVYSGPRGGGE